MNCPTCGLANRDGAQFCREDGTALTGIAGPPPKYVNGKNTFIATLISFLPAGGQFYNADYKKAFVVLGGYAICWFFAASWIGIPLALLLWVALFIWAILDAYGVAKRQKARW